MPDSNITKNALAKTMKELMAQKPFSKISVGDICEACSMNRKSFYYHFKDKYDLVNWIFYTEFIKTVNLPEDANGWQLIEKMCRYFYSEQDFYRSALQIQGQNSFKEYFSETLEPFILAFTRDLFRDMEEDAQFYITFFSDAFLLSVIRWLTEGAKIPPEKFLAQSKKILVYFAKQILADLGSDET